MPSTRPTVSLIAAMAENRVIGNRGRLPWRLPDEMKHFVRLTTGHTVVMGRKTFESIGSKPLPNRRNIILTRNPNYTAPGIKPPGIETAESIRAAIALANTTTELKGAAPVSAPDPSAIRNPPSPIPPELFICGGEQAYRDALPLADNLYLTLVHTSPEGDAHFPDYDTNGWRLTDQVRHEADARHAYAFTFHRYERLR